MAEGQGGGGWWLASDGQWYPPEQEPDWTVVAGRLEPARHRYATRAALVVVVGLIVSVGAAVVARHPSDSPLPASVADIASAAPPALMPPETPDGFTQYGHDVDRYWLAIPSSWETIDPAAEDYAAGLDAFKASNPNLAASVDAMLPVFAEGGVVSAFDTRTGATIGLVQFPMHISLEPEIVLEAMAGEFEAMGGSDLTVNAVTLPAGEGMFVSMRLPLAVPGGERFDVTEQMYVLDGAEGSWVLLFVTTDPERDAELFDQIIATLRVS